jgi:GABA permease
MSAHSVTPSSVEPPPGGSGTGSSPDGLTAGLRNRYLSMIAIGGVIGAGLFVGSATGIATAGPASWSRTRWSA